MVVCRRNRSIEIKRYVLKQEQPEKQKADTENKVEVNEVKVENIK